MSIISKRMEIIKPSPTLAISQKAAELKKQGIDIISLGAGEPDFDTPENIKDAAITAIKQGITKYTNVDGMPALKQAVKDKFLRENGIEYQLDEIIICTGGKQVIYNLFMASLNEGDEVIIPAPYWVSYPDIVALAGGVAVQVICDISSNFKLTPKALENAITEKSKWLIINSPSNPTGAAYSKTELEGLAEILRKYPNLNIMSDDIYEHITFGDFLFTTLAQVAPDLKDRIFTVNGVSKAYSMTGWRIGYGAGNKELIKAMIILQSQSTSNPSSISQAAAIEALNGTQDFIQINANKFQQKRDLAIDILKQAQELACNIPEGAFYLFVECKGLFGLYTGTGNKINNSNDFSQYLLEQAHVAVVSGIAFGLEGYFRISYALSFEDLKQACIRIVEACEQLRP